MMVFDPAEKWIREVDALEAVEPEYLEVTMSLTATPQCSVRSRFAPFFISYKAPRARSEVVLTRLEMSPLILPDGRSVEDIAAEILARADGRPTPVYLGENQSRQYIEVVHGLVQRGVPVFLVGCACNDLPALLAETWNVEYFYTELGMCRGVDSFAGYVEHGLIAA
ncbi:hypothetical protein HY629_00050 [Candidatus Uhrbacteria bacterium]|nr:hypothetical protein [Candidatus Uhrbacteria bacterium]